MEGPKGGRGGRGGSGGRGGGAGGQPGEAGGRGEPGQRGERGRQGKSSWGEWVRWGVTMVALGIALLNMQNIGQNADEGRQQIVETGRVAIASGCETDNGLRTELKETLEVFLEDHESLHKIATRFNVPIDHHNLIRIQASIDGIRLRDCDRVAKLLQVD